MIREISVSLGIMVAAGVVFSSPVATTPAFAAFDLGEPQCGGEYGGLGIRFSRRMRNFSDIDARIRDIPWIKRNYLVLGGQGFPSTNTNIYKEVKEAWQRNSDTSSRNSPDHGDFPVPIGSERYIAEVLYNTGIARSITHASGICGGAEVSYALVRRTSVGRIEDPARFEVFAARAVRSYLARAGTSYSITEGRLSVPPMEPFFATKRFTIAISSVISRGPQWNSTWDKYDLVLGLLARRASDYLVVVHTENLRTAPKLNGRPTPPSNEHFRATNPNESLADYEAEFVAAASFGRFLAGNANRCRVVADGIDAEVTEPFRCTMSSVEE